MFRFIDFFNLLHIYMYNFVLSLRLFLLTFVSILNSYFPVKKKIKYRKKILINWPVILWEVEKKTESIGFLHWQISSFEGEN